MALRQTGMRRITWRRAPGAAVVSPRPHVRRSLPGPALALGLAALTVAGCTSPVLTAHLALPHLRTGAACRARPGWAAITLTDTSPTPAITLRVGSPAVVTVPHWGWGKATDVRTARNGILREVCTVVLPDRGRRTIFLATKPGHTWLGATVEPASNLEMPSWGGDVTVQAVPRT
jgi:hypothetical protein